MDFVFQILRYLKTWCVTSSLPRAQDTSCKEGEIQNVQTDSINPLAELY